MTYWQFHVVFTLPLLAFVVWLNRNNRHAFSPNSRFGIGLLTFLAVGYTTPWDSYLIKEKIWSYYPENILFTIYRIPIEEYFFFIIQTSIGCLLVAFLLSSQNKNKQNYVLQIGPTQLTLLFFLNTLLFASWFFLSNNPQYLYLKLIVYWSLPVLFLQWSLGSRLLLQNKTTLLKGVGLLTVYFCIADSVALHLQIWFFPENTISGVLFFGILPLEEALFFFVTNIMVVQGYLLFTQLNFRKVTLQWKRPVA